MKPQKFLMYMLLSLVAWIGCYPAGPDYIEDLDITYTTYDETFDFSSKSTYSMPDKIVIGVEIDRFGDTTYVYMKDKFAKPILDKIDANLQARGWSKVDVGNTPDMLMLPAGMSTTSYYYDYWYCWWYGGWYPGWGWYYPPYYSVSSLTTGSLILTFADPNAGDDNPINQSGVAWLAVSNGVLTGNDDLNRALKAIDQSFDQSPYLITN